MLRDRSGFSLIEVLIASVVISSALLAVLGAVSVIFKSSRSSGVVMSSALFATERLDYFQKQTNPFMAAGGTWYPPPYRRNERDMNQLATLHNRFQGAANRTPVLFVREWLYDTTEKRYSDNAAAPDQGRRGQGGRVTGAAVNVIPATPSTYQPPGNPNRFQVAGILPNVNPVTTAAGSQPFLQPENNNWETNDFWFLPAPRANARDPFNNVALVNGVALPPSIRYMREVWVQTNQPEMVSLGFGCPNWAAIDAGFPILTYPLAGVYRPPAIPADRLPPWVVAVTVRVFERDPLCRTWSVNGPVLDGSGGATTAYTAANRNNSLGYDPRRPLAVVTGYFGLRRQL